MGSELYRRALQSYYLTRWQLGRWKQLVDPLRQRCNGGVYAVELTTRAGFFGVLTNLVYLLAHADATGRKPYVRLTGPTYRWPDDQSDWFDNYFVWRAPLDADEEEALRRGQMAFTPIADVRELGLPSRYPLSLRRAHTLFRRHVGIRDDILAEVDAYSRQAFADRVVLGLHYRGTDKWIEAPRVQYAQMSAKAARLIGRLPRVDLVHVATDERGFIDFMQAQSLGVPIVWSEGHEVTCGRRALQSLPHGNRYRRGREALVTSLILSRCQYCLKTASLLSAWSKVFNPDLPVVLVNTPHRRGIMFGDSSIRDDQFMTL